MKGDETVFDELRDFSLGLRRNDAGAAIGCSRLSYQTGDDRLPLCGRRQLRLNDSRAGIGCAEIFGPKRGCAK